MFALLDPSVNHDECISDPPHVFHLPVGDSSIEVNEWVQGSAILTGVRMILLENGSCMRMTAY